MVMDGEGNIGMGYVTSSASERVTMRYTGRLADDPLNEMTLESQLIIESTGANPSNRLADYTHTVIDAEDDQTMWFIAEVMVPTKRNYVGVFNIAQELLGTDDFEGLDDSFVIGTEDNNIFNVSLTTDQVDERIVYSVYNVSGQIVSENHITKEGGSYSFELNMSYATPGVYIVKLHNNKSGISKKILVK